MTTQHPQEIAGELVLPHPAGALPPAPEPELSIRTAADVPAEPVRWLWKDHLALGKIAVVAGPANVGKSLLVAGDFAARVSAGAAWPDGWPCPGGDVLIASGHDGAADTLVPRLRDHGADLRRVHFVDDFASRESQAPAERLLAPGGLPLLDRALQRRPGVKLVVIDPVSAFFDSAGGAGRSRGVAALQEMARRCGAAFILVTALREAAAARTPAAVIGAPGLMSAARLVWVLTRDPDDPRRRLFTSAKNNLGGECHSYAWRLEGGKVQWETGPAQAGPALVDDAGRACGRREALAAAFVADFLKDGPRMWGVIEFHARLAGHRAATLERARGSVAETFKRLGREGRWLWRLIGDDRTSSPGDAADFFGDDPIGLRASGRSARSARHLAAAPKIDPAAEDLDDEHADDEFAGDEDLDDVDENEK